ncbi:MAG: bifunctional adenosylcobinamide kinase/adenosylcobinamide-phosphate guanylyltransferase [Hyphomicrobiaceae bacterium]
MSKIFLVTGGARSGKSALAERLVGGLGDNPIYIATAEPYDDEMANRITQHRARRGPEWTTLTVPINLTAALKETNGRGPRLVDCLTLWLSNLMLDNADWEAAAGELTAALADQHTPVVFVTNEVGAGIVPENKLARAFRDAAGLLNQRVAGAADEVHLAVSGLSLQLKPGSAR